MKADLIEEFRWRGLLYDSTEGVEEVLKARKTAGYIGFDPTADSLHVGNLLPIMGLVQMQRHGHTPIALVGGATGMIGDPSGKSKERNLLDNERLQHNLSCIRRQLTRFLDFDAKDNPAKLVNNYDWIGPMSFIEMLRDVGKHFPMSYMLGKESVKRRLDATAGISYTEFSYMLLQSYDFYHLYKEYGCELQMGGSDQWGNITAGTELVRRLAEKKAHGVVFPLVTTSSGEKFGKTVDGAVWLDPDKTSPYKFYQFWLNSVDEDALKYIKSFTLITEEAYLALEAEHRAAPHQRMAQKYLAEDVTRRVHGQEALDKVIRASKAMFGGDLSDMSAEDIGDVFQEVPSIELAKDRFEGDGVSVIDLFVESGAVKSKGEARRLLQGGGINVNNQRIQDMNHAIHLGDAIEGRFIVLRKGSKNYHLVKIVG